MPDIQAFRSEHLSDSEGRSVDCTSCPPCAGDSGHRVAALLMDRCFAFFRRALTAVNREEPSFRAYRTLCPACSCPPWSDGTAGRGCAGCRARCARRAAGRSGSGRIRRGGQACSSSFCAPSTFRGRVSPASLSSWSLHAAVHEEIGLFRSSEDRKNGGRSR